MNSNVQRRNSQQHLPVDAGNRTTGKRARELTRWLMCLGAVALVGTACENNKEGDLAASKFGDLTHGLPQRQATLSQLENTCGLAPPDDGAPAGILHRRPYLQRLTGSAVDVVWTANRSASPMTVVVSSPDGSIVSQVVAGPDSSSRPPDGSTQWIAAITGLEPGKSYCYQVRSGETTLSHAGFATPPAPGAGGTVRFVAFGDSGTGGSDQQAVRKQMMTVPFDLMIHTGDIAYSSGTRWQLEQFFFGMYGDLLGSIPAFPASGNHEHETEDAAPFREAFVLPENGGPEGRERWYSYDFGDVHFVALDSERVGPAQAAWLDADLSANGLPWTIVYLHRPPFSSGDHGSHVKIQQEFGPLFVKHRVPLVLSGHDHHYERTKPMNGVTYVVTGGGGRGTRPTGASDFTAFSESVSHFVYVTVAGDRLTLHAIDGIGVEFDSLMLQR